MTARKLIILSFLWIAFFSAIPSRAQTGNDSIPLSEAIDKIRTHYIVDILCKDGWLKGVNTLMPPYYYGLNEDLNYILNGIPISFYNYEDENIVMYRDASASGSSLDRRNIASLYSNILYRLDGRVLSEKEETPVIGATVYVKEQDKGTISGINGSFRFTLPAGDYTLVIQSVGFVDQQEKVELNRNTTVTWYLPTEVRRLDEVVISGHAEDNVRETSMGIATLTSRTLKTLPAFMGEVDVIKSLLLLPGVSTVGEAASGFNVRGGSADQNLVIFDEAPLFNSSHVFGLFSTFNQDFVDRVTLMKAGIPPRYGGRLSSVLDVRSGTSQSNRLTGEGGIGLFTSRLTLNVPVIKNKLTVIAGGRILYSDFLLGWLKNTALKNSKAFFYDGNLKVNYRINKKSNLYYSFYKSYDNFRLPSDTIYKWGTQNHAITYSQQVGRKLVMNATGVLAHYDYGLEEDMPRLEFNWDAGIRYKNAILDFFYQTSQTNNLNFGGGLGWYTLISGNLVPGPESFINAFIQDNEFAREQYVYASDEFDLFPFLRCMVGLRYSGFSQVGPGTIHYYREGLSRSVETMTGSRDYGKGEKISNSQGFEPRASIRILLDNLNSVKLDYNRLYQYIQQVSTTTGITPIDLWIPSGAYLMPQQCDQVSMGFYRNFQLNRFETSVEIYYKWIDHLVDYKNGAELFLNSHTETELLQGTGRAYGVELFAKKNLGRVTGWASYTFSRSLVKIEGNTYEETINDGNYYPSNFDIPNEFKVTANYQVNRRWSVAGNFVYNTGRPVTYPAAKYEVNRITIASYEVRNDGRIPDYHRLDFSVTMKGNNRKNKFWDGTWSFTLYNLYARRNAYSVYFKPIPGSRVPQAYKYAILGTIVPSITYNFKFL